MKTIKIIALATMLLTACSKESDDLTPASSNSGIEKSLAAPRPRPFEAILSAAVDVNSTNPPTACTGDAPFAAPDFLLSGDVSHLGAIRTNSTLHHDACNLSLAAIPFLLTTSVSGQIVAANGDYITYTGNDVVDVTSFALQQPNPTGSITGTWTITGGSGRFAGATGSFTIDGTVDFTTNTFTCTCLGTITY